MLLSFPYLSESKGRPSLINMIETGSKKKVNYVEEESGVRQVN